MVLDDISVSSDSTNVSMYLDVFREVFVGTGHGAHYKMMMPAETSAAIEGTDGVVPDVLGALLPVAPPALTTSA